VLQFQGQRRRFEARAQFAGRRLNAPEIVRRQCLDARAQRRPLFQRCDECFECRGAHHETRRNADAGALEFAQAAALAAHVGAILETDFREPADVLGR
jgi:hypothetical protein